MKACSSRHAGNISRGGRHVVAAAELHRVSVKPARRGGSLDVAFAVDHRHEVPRHAGRLALHRPSSSTGGCRFEGVWTQDRT